MKPKRTKIEKRKKIQQTLEGYRRFDYDYIPFGKKWTSPGATFKYNKVCRIGLLGAILRTVMATAGMLLIKVAYGAKVVGRENLRALKKQGAVCVCNHISFLDTLFVRKAVGHFRSYHTMAPQNNKTGLGGKIIRSGGMIPFSPNLTAMRNMHQEMGRLLKKGKIINFYAEQAMWQNYQKPRPMKDGPFYYAEKFCVPVLPVFCTFRKTKRGHMKKLRIHILPAVYGEKALCGKERMAKMKRDCETAWRECYEKAYNIPLVYFSKRKKHTQYAS